MPTALVLANATGRNLAPLSDRTPPALLPVAGRSLLEHCVDDLRAAGVRQAVVAVAGGSAVAQAVERLSGEGLTLTVVETAGDAEPWSLAARLAGGEEMLVLRADVLRTPIAADLLFQAAARPDAVTVSAVAGGIPAGAVVLRRAGAGTGDGWTPGEAVAVDGARAIPVDSPAALHRANLEAAAGRFAGLSPTATAEAVPPEAVVEAPVLAAPGVEIDPGARLGPGVVIGEGSMVEYGARLRSTVVLPDTYVGERLELTGAVVWGDTFIDIASGQVTRVSDRMLLADLGNRRRRNGQRSRSGWLAPRAVLRNALQSLRQAPAAGR